MTGQNVTLTVVCVLLRRLSCSDLKIRNITTTCDDVQPNVSRGFPLLHQIQILIRTPRLLVIGYDGILLSTSQASSKCLSSDANSLEQDFSRPVKPCLSRMSPGLDFVESSLLVLLELARDY